MPKAKSSENLCLHLSNVFMVSLSGATEWRLPYYPKLQVRILMMPQPAIAGSSTEQNWAVFSGRGGILSPLSITETLPSIMDFCKLIHAEVGKWCIPLSVTPPLILHEQQKVMSFFLHLKTRICGISRLCGLL